MKKLYSLISAVILSASLWAQAPQKMSYQAVIRGANNALVVDKPVGVRISILQGTEFGASVYVETHTTTTNSNGLASLSIGTGKIITGDFSKIDWSKGPYFVKTETDVEGGTNYQLTSVSELMSVPYALYAGNGIKRISANSDTIFLSNDKFYVNKSSVNVGNSSIPTGGGQGQVLTMCEGILTWTNGGVCPGKIESLDCSNFKVSGDLKQGVDALNTSLELYYKNGNGGEVNSLPCDSKYVLGLTAKLENNKLNYGDGVLKFSLSGIPKSSGNAIFSILINDKSCLISLPVIQTNLKLIDFEDFSLPKNSYLDSSKLGYFSSKNCMFQNKYNKEYKYLEKGFALSSKIDTVIAGYTNMYSSFAGGGVDNSSNYIVGLDSSLIKLPINTSIVSFYVTNNTYAALSMRNGDAFAKKFSKGDYFKLVVYGYKNGLSVAKSEIYLADFTSVNSNDFYIQKKWKKILTPEFKNIDEIRFKLESSDMGQYGLNTPAFFVLDNIEIE